MAAAKKDPFNARQARQTRGMSNEQRRAAVKRSEEVGAKQAAAELGIAEQTLYAWRSKLGAGPLPQLSPNGRRYDDALRDRALAMRQAEGRTRTEIARQLGVGESTVRRWEQEAKASNGHAPAPAAPHDESPQSFLAGYEGPQGRVEAVRARYDLSIEEAALVVRRHDGREPEAIQLQLDAPAMEAMSEIERELHALRRENRALRVLVQTYLPRVDL